MAGKRTGAAACWLGVLRLSLRQLQQRWLESMLIVLGIALGVGVLTTGETFVRFQSRVFTDFVAGQAREWAAITVQPLTANAAQAFYGAEAVPAVRVSLHDLEEPVQFTLGDVLAIRDVPGVRHVTVQRSTRGMSIAAIDGVGVESDTSFGGIGHRPQLNLEMVTPDEFHVAGYEFVAGRPFTWDDFNAGERHIVLESQSAQRLFPDALPQDMIGRTVTTMGAGDGHRWIVVGVVELPERERSMVQLLFGTASDYGFGYMPATVDFFSLIRPGADVDVAEADVMTWTTNRLYLSPVDESFIGEIIKDVQLYFDQKYGSTRVELRNPQAEREAEMGAFTPGVIALLILAGLGLIIAAVNVLNLFTARVMRRMRLAGMSVALGATSHLLFWQTAAEALLLGGVGSGLGVGLATGFVAVMRGLLIGQISDLPDATGLFGNFFVGLPDVLVGIGAGIALSLIFGLYPAWIGARHNPADALRIE